MSRKGFIWLLCCVISICRLTEATDDYRSPGNGYVSDKCVPIEIPMCTGLRYNMTHMPNMAGHATQKEAMQVHEFTPLVDYGCSNLLRFFLCSVYAPMCTEQMDEMLIIPVCQSMCLEVRKHCEPVLQRFNFHWPDILDCANFPVKSDSGVLCMEVPLADSQQSSDSYEDSISHRKGSDTIFDKEGRNAGGSQLKQEKQWQPQQKQQQLHRAVSTPLDNGAVTCSARFVEVDVTLKNNGSCVPRCDVDVLFTREAKHNSEILVGVLCCLCLISFTITLVMFYLEPNRLRFPDRPILYLSICYAAVSLAYMLRFAVGRAGTTCDHRNALARDVFDSTWCIIVFVLLYFFGMASSAWWVLLAITWFLSSCLKWGREAIEKLARYYHLAAWGLPAVQTLIVLMLRRVDGQELLGICYIGNNDDFARLVFVIVPLAVYTTVGCICMTLGFCAMCKIRKNLRKDGADTHKFDKLFVKISVFAGLYTTSACVVIGSHIYEYINWQRWLTLAAAIPCQKTTFSPTASVLFRTPPLNTAVMSPTAADCPLDESIPLVAVLFIKEFMSLIVGVCGIVWLCSLKTVSAWCSYCSCCCCLQQSHKQLLQIPTASSLQQPQPQQQLQHQHLQQQQQCLQQNSFGKGYHNSLHSSYIKSATNERTRI